MSTSFEKSVKGATKIKLAAPKSKYVEHILVATHAGEQGVAEVFRVLQNRLRDSTWTIVFKSLIVVHFMIREGEPNVTLRHLASNPQRKLAINNFTEVQTQGRNIRAYADYLVERVKSYGSTKVDFVKAGEGRLTRLSVEKGLLREVESVQDLIKGLLRCDFLTSEPENDISLTAFRLLIMDLLVLFHVMNEGMVNILQHFFEMSKPDAERTLDIYRMFVRQTESVVKYLSVARNYEHVTRLEIPTLKHAPTILTGQLEEYVRDNDFEMMRRQYLAQQTSKPGKSTNGTTKFFDSKPATATKSEPFPEPKTDASASRPTKGPAPDLIDFFESIDQNQTTSSTNPFQQGQFAQQHTIADPQNIPQQQGLGQQSIPQQQSFGQQNVVPQQGFAQQTPFGMQTSGMPSQQQQFGAQPIGFQNQPVGFGNQTTGMPGQHNYSPVANQPTSNPFAQIQNPPSQPLQQNYTGAGFGGYTAQPQQNRFTPGLSSIPQNTASSFQPTSAAQSFSSGTDSPASSNPFRQSMLSSATGTSMGSFGTDSNAPAPLSAQSTNPFAKSALPQQNSTPPNTSLPFAASSSQFSNMNLNSMQVSAAQPLMPGATGTNPFARQNPTGPPPSSASPFSAGGVTTHVTGSTNPFRQSPFVNQATGSGWQGSAQGTIGGMHPDQIQTTSIFPRPGGQPNLQSQATSWPQS